MTKYRLKKLKLEEELHIMTTAFHGACVLASKATPELKPDDIAIVLMAEATTLGATGRVTAQVFDNSRDFMSEFYTWVQSRTLSH